MCAVHCTRQVGAMGIQNEAACRPLHHTHSNLLVRWRLIQTTPGLHSKAVSAALQFTRSELLACVEAHADSILSVHQDTGVHAYDSVTATDGGPLAGAQPTADTSNSTINLTGGSSGIETSAPWALDRLDQTSLPLDSPYHYYSTGSNVNIYIIDTVRLTSALSRPARVVH